jgi:hypothetical protein
MSSRRIGTVILSILIILGSLFNIFGVLWIVSKNLSATAIVLWGITGKIIYLVAVPLGILEIIFALGTLRLKDKSRRSLVGLFTFNLIWVIMYRLAVYATLFIRKTEIASWTQWIQWVNRETILSALFDLLPVLIIIYYFTRPKVKEQFK